MKTKQHYGGFTLIELLVVIAIIAIGGVVVAVVEQSQRVGASGSLPEQPEADSVGVEHVRAG